MLAKGPASRFPVSKSRLEACGSSVPRPTTAPSAHPGKPKAMAAELSKAESSSKLEQEYIYNLQQQVYLQELELKYVKQQKASNTFDSSTSEPVDASLHNIKGSYKHMEADFAKRMHQEEDRHNELREEALRAVMHEKRAHAEKTKVVDQLARVREQFSSQRQELTAEVVGLQRELEKCFLSEKTLRTELEQASTQLKDIRVFSDGADAQACRGEGEGEGEGESTRVGRTATRAWGRTQAVSLTRRAARAQVRMKNSQLEESARQLTSAAEREGSLQRELRDEQAQTNPSPSPSRISSASSNSSPNLSRRRAARSRTSTTWRRGTTTACSRSARRRSTRRRRPRPSRGSSRWS